MTLMILMTEASLEILGVMIEMELLGTMLLQMAVKHVVALVFQPSVAPLDEMR